MRTILVTGGAGFVGSHACKALAGAGYSPVTLDNRERGHDWAVKWGPLERGDLRDEKVLRHVFGTWKPWGIMHLRGSVEETLNRPARGRSGPAMQCAAYERSEARRDTRAGHYERKLQTRLARCG